MPKLCIAIFAALTLAVLSLTVAVATAKRVPMLSAQIVKINMLTNGLEIRVRLTNGTPYVYSAAPASLEIFKDGAWQFLWSRSRFSDTPTVYGMTEFSWLTLWPKPGARCRLVIEGQRAKSGLRSFLFRLRRRVRGDFAMPLNPFDPTPIVYTETVAITEFKAPQIGPPGRLGPSPAVLDLSRSSPTAA